MCTFHRAVQNSPDHLWPAEIEGEGENEESELLLSLRNAMTCCAVSLECTKSFTYFMPRRIKCYVQEFYPYTDLINTICEALGLHSPWTYYTNNTSPTVVPKRLNWTQENLVSTVFVSCRPAYKKEILLDRLFKNLFFPHLQCSMLEFFSYDVTLTQLPESMKAVVLSTSLLLHSLSRNQWI